MGGCDEGMDFYYELLHHSEIGTKITVKSCLTTEKLKLFPTQIIPVNATNLTKSVLCTS